MHSVRSNKSGITEGNKGDDWDDTLRFFFLEREGCESPVTHDDAGYDPKVYDAMRKYSPPKDGDDVFAVAVAFADSGVYYGAAVKPEDADDPWDYFGKESYVGDYINEDGITEEIEIDETTCLLSVADGKTPVGGVWVGGEKYTMCKSEETVIRTVGFSGEVTESPVRITLIARHRQGVYIAKSPAQVVACVWRGDPDVNGGNCKWYLYNFMKVMVDQGIYEAAADDEVTQSRTDESSYDTNGVSSESEGDWVGC